MIQNLICKLSYNLATYSKRLHNGKMGSPGPLSYQQLGKFTQYRPIRVQNNPLEHVIPR